MIQLALTLAVLGGGVLAMAYIYHLRRCLLELAEENSHLWRENGDHTRRWERLKACKMQPEEFGRLLPKLAKRHREEVLSAAHLEREKIVAVLRETIGKNAGACTSTRWGLEWALNAVLNAGRKE